METLLGALGEVVVLLHQHQDWLLTPHHLVEEGHLRGEIEAIQSDRLLTWKDSGR